MHLPLNLIMRNDTELLVCALPSVRVEFFFGDELAFEEVSEHEVVVHCVCDDFGDFVGGELDEAKVF